MNSPDASQTESRSRWWVDAGLGAVFVAIGILLLAWPGRTVVVTAVLVGLYLLVAGALRIGLAIWDDTLQDRWAMGLVGLAGLLAGLIILRNPSGSIELVALVLGLYWVFSGALDIFAGVTHRQGGSAAGGVVAVVAGGVLVLWLDISLSVLAFLGGLLAVILGLMRMTFAWSDR